MRLYVLRCRSTIKSNIKSKRCLHLESACEIIVCEICPSESTKLIICGFYRPPSSNYEYLMTFNSSLESIIRSSLPLVLCGDFNFPEIN